MSQASRQGTLRVTCPSSNCSSQTYWINRSPRSPSIDKDGDHRWSDIVPADTGLTFAVLWDPEEEIILFSSAALPGSSSSEESISSSRPTSPDSPVSVHGSETDIDEMICNSTPILVPFPSDNDCDNDTDTTLAYFCDHHNFLFHSASSDCISRDAKRPCRTQASSTLDGLDVYAKGSLINGVHPRVTKYSCLNLLDQEFTFNPCTSFARLRESCGFDGEVEVHMDDGWPSKLMKKRIGNVIDDFRMTILSLHPPPSQEITDEASSHWTKIHHPHTPTPSRIISLASQYYTPRRLRKTRTNDHPASPIEVLKRTQYGHDIPPERHLTGSRHTLLPKFMTSMLKCRRPDDHDDWVYIEVTHEPEFYPA